jgi:uncharacterized protein (DUF58 family)
MPWESRSTVLLDTRAAAHQGESFERAVEVAASLVTALCRGRRQVRFLTTGGVEIRSTGRDRYPSIMEYLAAVAPDGNDHFDMIVTGLRRTGGDGPLAGVLANASRRDLSALGALRPRTGFVVLALLRPSSYGGVDMGQAPAVPGAVVVPVSGGVPFRDAWNQAVISCRRSAAVRS